MDTRDRGEARRKLALIICALGTELRGQMLFNSHGWWSGHHLAVPNLVARNLVVWDSSAPYQTAKRLGEPTGNGLKILTEKMCEDSRGRCQKINQVRDNALHGSMARDQTKRKESKAEPRQHCSKASNISGEWDTSDFKLHSGRFM